MRRSFVGRTRVDQSEEPRSPACARSPLPDSPIGLSTGPMPRRSGLGTRLRGAGLGPISSGALELNLGISRSHYVANLAGRSSISMAGSDGCRSWVRSSAEQVLERCRGDGGQNSIVPLEEVLVAGDDVVGLVLSCQRNGAVIVGVSGCSNDRDSVVDEVGNSSNGRQAPDCLTPAE